MTSSQCCFNEINNSRCLLEKTSNFFCAKHADIVAIVLEKSVITFNQISTDYKYVSSLNLYNLSVNKLVESIELCILMLKNLDKTNSIYLEFEKRYVYESSDYCSPNKHIDKYKKDIQTMLNTIVQYSDRVHENMLKDIKKLKIIKKIAESDSSKLCEITEMLNDARLMNFVNSNQIGKNIIISNQSILDYTNRFDSKYKKYLETNDKNTNNKNFSIKIVPDNKNSDNLKISSNNSTKDKNLNTKTVSDNSTTTTTLSSSNLSNKKLNSATSSNNSKSEYNNKHSSIATIFENPKKANSTNETSNTNLNWISVENNHTIPSIIDNTNEETESETEMVDDKKIVSTFKKPLQIKKCKYLNCERVTNGHHRSVFCDTHKTKSKFSPYSKKCITSDCVNNVTSSKKFCDSCKNEYENVISSFRCRECVSTLCTNIIPKECHLNQKYCSECK